MASIIDEFDFDDFEPEGERPWCDTCHNTGEVDCYCGGDLCVCGGETGCGTDFCPKCDRGR